MEHAVHIASVTQNYLVWIPLLPFLGPDGSVALAAGLDVFVLGALRHRPHPTHFTVAEAVAAAQRIGARRTFLTHMCHDLGHAATCAALPEGITLAFDGLAIDVG